MIVNLTQFRGPNLYIDITNLFKIYKQLLCFVNQKNSIKLHLDILHHFGMFKPITKQHVICLLFMFSFEIVENRLKVYKFL